jgi:hypothetical protein
MGSPEAKELFLRPEGTHLIDLGLQSAAERGWPMHVITRPEKKSLVLYLEKIPNVSIQKIGPTFDWPETLLASEPYWQEWNLVFLPDMDFKPRNVLDEMAAKMTGANEVVTANHLVKDASQWGILWPEAGAAPADFGIRVGEKVPINSSEPRWAWGIYAFRKSVGRALLQAQLESCRDHRLKHLALKATAVPLTEFQDLTRGEVELAMPLTPQPVDIKTSAKNILS